MQIPPGCSLQMQTAPECRPPGHVTSDACWETTPSLWTEWLTGVKTLPFRNYCLRPVIKQFERTCSYNNLHLATKLLYVGTTTAIRDYNGNSVSRGLGANDKVTVSAIALLRYFILFPFQTCSQVFSTSITFKLNDKSLQSWRLQKLNIALHTTQLRR